MSDELLYTQEDIDEWARTCEELQDKVKELREEISELREKYEQLKKTYDYNIAQECKGTAKEILKSLLDRFGGYEMSYYNGYEEVVAEFEQFIKAFFNEEFGVEVEE